MRARRKAGSFDLQAQISSFLPPRPASAGDSAGSWSTPEGASQRERHDGRRMTMGGAEQYYT